MEIKSLEIGMPLVQELLRERTRLQARVTELETELIFTKFAQKTQGSCSGVEEDNDVLVVQETHLGERVRDCSQCNENNKKIEELENGLKSMQERVEDMEARHDAGGGIRKSSEDALTKDDGCLIKFEKEDANKWVPPPEGYLKLNVDALNFWYGGGVSPLCTAIGAVIRDHKGDIYIYHSMYFSLKLKEDLSETMLNVTAMREGLRWVETLSLPNRGLIVETEFLVLAEQLASGREVWSEYGMAVMECRLLMRSLNMEEIIVKRVKSEANRLAHEIAANCSGDVGSTNCDHKRNYISDAPRCVHIRSIADSERPTNSN